MDYEIEAGATRNFMALKLAEEQAQREEDEEKEEEATNFMKLHEKKIVESKRVMELHESLEACKAWNRRNENVDYDKMLGQYDQDKKTKRQKELEIDEQLVQSIFKRRKIVDVNTYSVRTTASSTSTSTSTGNKRAKLLSGLIKRKISTQTEEKPTTKPSGLSLLGAYFDSEGESD